MKKHIALSVVAALAIVFATGCCPGNGSDFIDFEDLALGTEYHVGPGFTTSGVNVSVEPFQWGNNVWTSDGFAKVDSNGHAHGSGQDMNVNNVNLSFDFGDARDSVSLKLGEFGGNCNIEVNEDFVNFADFPDINGTTIGGTNVTFTTTSPGGHNYWGTLSIAGEISSFAIGGQELWIDDVEATY